MDTTTQLFIRACKSKDPRKRLLSVYKRIYMRGLSEAETCPAIVCFLARIADDYSLITTMRLIDKLNPDSSFNEKASYFEMVRAALITEIRLTNLDKLPGLTIPAKFRNT